MSNVQETIVILLKPTFRFRPVRARGYRLIYDTCASTRSPRKLSSAAGADGGSAPNAALLIANLDGFNSAGMPNGWSLDADGQQRFCIDHYLEERAV